MKALKTLAIGAVILLLAPLFFVAAGIVLLAQNLAAMLPDEPRAPRAPYQGAERRGTARWQEDRGIDG